MKSTKNNIPPVVEEQIICQEQETLTKQQVIPQDFVELTTRGKNYMCSTEGWKEPVCERYGFSYENNKKWLTLDIPQELMEKLGLESGKNCSELIFISPEVLKRETECGGVALKNEKEIFLAPQKSKLFREKGVQTNLEAEKSSEIEKEAKRFSEEKIRNLQEDIQNLNQEKQELIEKIKELENGKSILTKEEQEFIDFVVSNFNFEDYEQMKSAISDLSETLGERFEKQEETSFPNLKQIVNNFCQLLSNLHQELSWWDNWIETKWGIVNIYTYDANWRIEPCYPFVDYKGRCETIRRVPFSGENVYTINEINKVFSEEEVIKKIKENIKLAHDFLLLLPKIEASKEGSESEEE